MRAKKTAASIAATAMALALAACGGGGSSDGSSGGSGGASGGGSLNLGVLVPATTQAAKDANWANESPYMQAVYDSLIRLSPDAEPEPWLATEWSYNKDNTVLTMKLRTDVKFTDGTPFNADVAAQNIIRFRDGVSPNKAFLANVKDAKAVDDGTLEITLTQPDPALLIYLGQNAGLQESPKAFGAKDEKTNPVGSGPYVLDTGKTVIGSKYVYTKNPDYWAPEEQHYDNLTLTVLADAQTQVNAIRGGQVNGLNLIDQSSGPQVEGAGYTLYPHELDWAGLMLMDREGTLNPALGEVKVRQAINYAIDRDAMLKATQNGSGTVTDQIFPTTRPGYDEGLNDRYPFDPEKAKQLLSEAGYADGFELTMPQIPVGSNAIWDLTKQYLGDVGITVKYEQQAINEAIPAILGAKYAASYFILQMDPTTWSQANFTFSENATWNPFHVADPTITKLVGQVQNGTEEEADAASGELNKYLVEQAWFAPWFRLESNYAADKNTEVTQQSENAYPYLWNIKPKA